MAQFHSLATCSPAQLATPRESSIPNPPPGNRAPPRSPSNARILTPKHHNYRFPSNTRPPIVCFRSLLDDLTGPQPLNFRTQQFFTRVGHSNLRPPLTHSHKRNTGRQCKIAALAPAPLFSRALGPVACAERHTSLSTSRSTAAGSNPLLRSIHLSLPLSLSFFSETRKKAKKQQKRWQDAR